MRPRRKFNVIDSYWKLAKMVRIYVPKYSVSFFTLSLWPFLLPEVFSNVKCILTLHKDTGSCSAILSNIDTFKSIWNWWLCLHKFITPNGHLFPSLPLSTVSVFFPFPPCSISILYPICLLPSEFLPCNFPFVVVTMGPWRVGRISKELQITRLEVNRQSSSSGENTVGSWIEAQKEMY
jgi:hypothetical protein